jgi:hypothetical protein
MSTTPKSFLVPLLLILLTLLISTGCAPYLHGINILPISNGERVALDAEDIYLMLSCVGFDNEMIIEEGAKIRNALSSVGAAKLMDDDRTQTVFTVSGGSVNILSRTHSDRTYTPLERSCI